MEWDLYLRHSVAQGILQWYVRYWSMKISACQIIICADNIDKLSDVLDTKAVSRANLCDTCHIRSLVEVQSFQYSNYDGGSFKYHLVAVPSGIQGRRLAPHPAALPVRSSSIKNYIDP